MICTSAFAEIETEVSMSQGDPTSNLVLRDKSSVLFLKFAERNRPSPRSGR